MKYRGSRARFAVLVRIERPERAGDPDFFGSTHDLSQTGMLLRSPHALELGERIRIRIFLPRNQAELDLEAMVIRQVFPEEGLALVSSDEPKIASDLAYGVELLQMSDEDRKQISGYLSGLTGEAQD